MFYKKKEKQNCSIDTGFVKLPAPYRRFEEGKIWTLCPLRFYLFYFHRILPTVFLWKRFLFLFLFVYIYNIVFFILLIATISRVVYCMFLVLRFVSIHGNFWDTEYSCFHSCQHCIYSIWLVSVGIVHHGCTVFFLSIGSLLWVEDSSPLCIFMKVLFKRNEIRMSGQYSFSVFNSVTPQQQTSIQSPVDLLKTWYLYCSMVWTLFTLTGKSWMVCDYWLLLFPF